MRSMQKVMLTFFFCLSLFSQQDSISTYDRLKAFDGDFYLYPGSETRSVSGKPGHAYWQNEADYIIDVELDTLSNVVMGKEIIKYTNNSPDKLDFLWLHLDQNLFIKESRGNALIPIEGSRNGTKGQFFDAGFKISAVQLITGKGRNKKISDAKYVINDTRMRVSLPESLEAKGGTVSLKIDFSFISPNYGSDRMGILETENGKIYSVAQWYPRMCVYDDVKGWDNLPYLGQGEFYLEYGDFNVNITVPANQIVVCSGELLNPLETYTLEQLDRWVLAESSDDTVVIRSAEEVNDPLSRPQNREMLTWRFRMENTRDVSWASSSAFVVDAAKINLPSGKKSTAVSAYPVESIGDNGWERSTEYTKASVEYYSEDWFEYPYPYAVNVASNVLGIEYPGISFCSFQSKGSRLWGVTDHEIGHNWFPMIVGTNERLYGWMDEGFNTLVNYLSTERFNDGEYRSRKPPMRMFGKYLASGDIEPLITYPDNLVERNMSIQYYKTAMVLALLRNSILGEEMFDDAFKQYIERWAYKHPTPYDFFRTIEDVSGEDLSWFWRSWIYNSWSLDQSVIDVSYPSGSAENGAVITIANMREVPMPVVVEITTESGAVSRKKLPVEIWKKGPEWSFGVNYNEKIKKVVLDPDFEYPDINGENNIWVAEE